MPQTETAKKHHHIPEFYLKRWTCSADRRLVEFRRHYGGVVKARKCFPSATGYSRPGYALAGFPPETASALEEHFFKPVDTRAAQVLTKLESGVRNLTDAERVAWTQFLISLVHRHPKRIKQLRQMFEDITLDISKADQRHWNRRRRSGDPKLYSEAMRSDWQENADQQQRRVLSMMTDAISSELIGSHIAMMRWSMLRMPPTVPAFLTADMPVNWFAPLTDPHCHILLPIGPKRLFYAVNTPAMGLAVSSWPADRLVAFLNDRTVRRAFDCAYGMTETALPYMQERLGIEPQADQGDMAYTIPTAKRRKQIDRRVAAARKRRRL